MDHMIEVENVSKNFKDTRALDDVSLAFEQNKIHGIIGRNGSGKTVLLKCICGFMIPDKGRISINGKKIAPQKSQDIGIIIDSPGFNPNMSAYKNLKMLASLNRRISKQQIKDMISLVGLDPDSKKHVGKFSMGMKQRLGLAQAIMEEPPLLILDEPMNGLDKEGVSQMRELLLSLKEKGLTIVLSSHYAEDIHLLCDTVTVMEAGKVVSMTAKELRNFRKTTS